MNEIMTVRKTEECIPTGNVIWNLVLSNNKDGGFLKGSIVNLIGESSSGKTMAVLNMYAELSNLSAFKDYRLIYDGVEEGNVFDIKKLFGKKASERIEYASNCGDGRYNLTVESLYYKIDTLINDKKPFIYVCDSLDALSSKVEFELFDKNKEAHIKGNKEKGDYVAMKVAQLHSKGLRKIHAGISETNSLVILLSQTRVDVGNPYSSGTRSGGKALKFFSSYEMWMACGSKIKIEDPYKEEHIIGFESCMNITKNRGTGKQCLVRTPIYYSYGIDDIGSCVNYLIKKNIIKKGGSWFTLPFNDDKGEPYKVQGEPKIIPIIEENNLETKIKELTEKAWHSVEKSIKITRKKKFSN